MNWHIVVIGGLVFISLMCLMGFCFIKILDKVVDDIVFIDSGSSSDYSQAAAIESMFSEDGSIIHNFNNAPVIPNEKEDEHERCSIG